MDDGNDGLADIVCVRRQGSYVLIAVNPKSDDARRYWLSVGGAEVLAAELDGALRAEGAKS